MIFVKFAVRLQGVLHDRKGAIINVIGLAQPGATADPCETARTVG